MRTFGLIVLCLAAACSSDNAPDARIFTDGPLPDARPPSPDAPAPDAGPSAAVLRGQYLVDHVLACGDCHTPRDQNGPIAAKYLSGVECFIDIMPGAAGGCLHSRNLTNDATGLKPFT